MDVKTTFLNGNMEEDVYMIQPEGFVDPKDVDYTDASFQTEKNDSQLQSSFLFCLNGGTVSWKTSNQDTVVDSTTEDEHIATSEAAKEVVWIKKFIVELEVVPSISDAIKLRCDNNRAIHKQGT
ncbi:secreted RxLR effector protein 161-like [Gossypium raimondii]|uniref:secreted RxLR effector protein 161-like n=1 Tax=Gossypium raimondii TaxID=29730 RepID=UPI00227B432F|nr:secreted RxLR effector protein 161-like [Gossypium raimondii]